MPAEIEDRPYGPDSTPEEIAALRARISYVEQGYILYREIPRGSEFHLDVLFGRIEELAREHACRQMLVDLTNARRPTAEHRAQLRQHLRRLAGVIDSATAFTEGNAIMTTAARFVVAGMPQKISVHRTREQAVQALEKRHRE